MNVLENVRNLLMGMGWTRIRRISYPGMTMSDLWYGPVEGVHCYVFFHHWRLVGPRDYNLMGTSPTALYRLILQRYELCNYNPGVNHGA